MIVCGTNDNSLRERPLCVSVLTLLKAISTTHAAEETRQHADKIQKSFKLLNETIDLPKISKHSKSKSQTYAQTKDIV